MNDVKLGGGLILTKNTVDVKIKKLVPEAVIPQYGKSGDAGLDITATSVTENELYIEFGTGLSLEIPDGFVGLLYPRSSLSNYHLVLSNHVGVVDSGYRGEIKFRFKKTNTGPAATYYKVGDRIGQLMVVPFPKVVFEEVQELYQSDRGTGGFGSTGK